MTADYQQNRSFRRIAEEQIGPIAEEEHDQTRLIHELKVHERELELQQEALQAVQEELREKNYQFTLLFHEAPIPYLLLNSAGMILMANEAASRLLQVPGAKMLHGRSFTQYLTTEDRRRFNHHLDQVQKTHRAHLADIALTESSENPRWCTLDSRFHGETDEGWIFMVMHDITSQKNLEDDLIITQNEAVRANRLKNLFLANTSHELRTSLHSISHLLNDTSMPREARDTVVQNNVKSTLRIINDILDYTAIEEGTLSITESAFTLEEIVQQIRDSYASLCTSKGISLQCRVQAPTAVELSGDKERITQILVNLMQNALDYTDRGRIDLVVVYKKINTFQGEVEFEVRDSGRGLSLEQQNTIWQEPFDEKTRFKKTTHGPGIGLPLCKRLAKLLGGQIYLNSNQGIGTSVFFSIPLYHAESNQKAGTATIQGDGRGEKKILIVEDNELNRLVLMDMLTQLGYSNLSGAADGKEALEILSRQGDFDLILMDVSMPRMDGIEATKHIRSGAVGRADIPIIAITAHTMTGDEATFLDVGMNAHIAKPFTRREVEAILTPFTQSDEESPE